MKISWTSEAGSHEFTVKSLVDAFWISPSPSSQPEECPESSVKMNSHHVLGEMRLGEARTHRIGCKQVSVHDVGTLRTVSQKPWELFAKLLCLHTTHASLKKDAAKFYIHTPALREWRSLDCRQHACLPRPYPCRRSRFPCLEGKKKSNDWILTVNVAAFHCYRVEGK